jgi:cell division protein FtsW (lipid II flippase)
LAQSITPLAGGLGRARSFAWPLLLEATLVATAIGLLLPAFLPLAAQDTGRDGRFAAPVTVVRGLPDPVLPELCARHGASAETVVRERLCAGARAASAERIDRLPSVLARAMTHATAAFRAPLDAAQQRVTDLRQQQRAGDGDLLALDQAIDAARAEIEPYMRRYALDAQTSEAPLPLACAAAWIDEVVRATAARSAAVRDTLRANAVLLAGAALDGHPAVGAVAASAMLTASVPQAPSCAGLDAAEALAAAATLMTDARNAPLAVTKNEAMQSLLHTARWQWACGALLALVLLEISRRAHSWIAGAGFALVAWAGAAWAGRVPWPLGSEHAFTLARPDASWHSTPAPFVLVMAGAGVMLLACSPWLRRATLLTPARAASVLAYPGLVAATGIGWLLLLDLSANGHFGNRYLALYHQGHLWLGALVFTLVAFLRQPLGRALAWTLSVGDGIAARLRVHIGAPGAGASLLVMALLVTGGGALLLLNMRQLTSELGRLWLVVGAAWFFFLRGTPLTERLARAGSSLGSLARYVWPLAFVVIVLVGAMIVTRDMGPLLIAGYGAGAFVAASLAMWRWQRGGGRVSAYAIAVIVFAGWIAMTTLALFRLGSIDDVTAARLENATAPLASANDHLALVTWFQRATPAGGYGPGAVPWCGFGTTRACAGVPAQIQSDYTFTALVGMFGWIGAWAVTIGCVAWLYELVRRHGRATRGEPRLVRRGARMANDEQAFLSWLCVTWVVLALCQLAVTVAGNLAVIPLTGVTFPFVSFGMTSLVVNMAMLALAASVNASSGDAHG